ncbi:MAG: hypothetical protein ACK5AZ_18780 [Bryobacteraceae bacterium]
MKVSRLALVLSLALAAAPGWAEKPNFTGEWEMDAARSDFGGLPAPDKLVRRVDHREPNLKISTTQATQMGEIKTDFTYTTDGREHTNMIRGSEFRSTLQWDEDILVVTSKRSFQGSELTIIERWTAAKDGKSMVVDTLVSRPGGESKVKVFLVKK